MLDTGGGDGLGGPGVGDASASGDGLGDGVWALGDDTGLAVEAAPGVTPVELRSSVDGVAVLRQL